MTSAEELRRTLPIHAYVGPNGGGKSLAMVHDTLATLAGVDWQDPYTGAGGKRLVYSTVRLLDERRAESPDESDAAWADLDLGRCRDPLRLPHPLYRPLLDFRTLLEVQHCDVLMDEVTGVASSRESQAMPRQVANKLPQLRRDDVILRWTAPNYARADKIIRECSQGVTYCKGYLRDKPTEGRQWRSRRWFRWSTFDAAAFDEFTAHKRDKLKPEAKQWYKREGKPAQDAYDTLDAVTALADVDTGGRCLHCGGRRPVAKCSCPDVPEYA